MASVFPGAFDVFPTISTITLESDDPPHNEVHNMAFDSIAAIQTAMGETGVVVERLDYVVDAANVGTTETDLYTDTAPNLANDREKLEVEYYVALVDLAADDHLRVYYADTVIFDLTALELPGTENCCIHTLIVRTDVATVRCVTELVMGAGVALTPSIIDVGSLTLSDPQTLKITGESADGDSTITAKLGSVRWRPAAAGAPE